MSEADDNPVDGYTGVVIGGPWDRRTFNFHLQYFDVAIDEPLASPRYETPPQPPEKTKTIRYVWMPIFISSSGDIELYAWVPSTHGRADTLKTLLTAYGEVAAVKQEELDKAFVDGAIKAETAAVDAVRAAAHPGLIKSIAKAVHDSILSALGHNRFNSVIGKGGKEAKA